MLTHSRLFLIFFMSTLLLTLLLTSNVSEEAASSILYDDPLESVFGKIQYAALLVRHGDRNPMKSYPNDPYKNHEWPGGTANLNKRGKLKQYSLGKWLRNRYNHLVTGKWEDDGPYFTMHSSEANRTLLSGLYLQYGFFHLDVNNLKNLEEKSWEPVEVQIIPKNEDNVLGLWRQRQCKYFVERKEYLYSVPTVRQKLMRQDEIVAYIAKHAGYDFTNKSLNEQYDILADLYDTIISQAENGVQLPDWAHKIFPHPFDRIANSRMRIKSRDPVCLRFTAGPFLKILITEMKQHIKCCGLMRPALHFFMGHDYISMVVMSALGTFNDMIPPYANVIIFELRKKGDFDVVTMSLKNTTSGPLYLLEIPACGPLCHFNTFFRITENCHIFPDWDGACNKPYRVYK